MAHQRDVPAFAQGLPRGQRIRGRGRHRDYERKDRYDLEHTKDRLLSRRIRNESELAW